MLPRFQWISFVYVRFGGIMNFRIKYLYTKPNFFVCYKMVCQKRLRYDGICSHLFLDAF